MRNGIDWKSYVKDGDLELPTYLYNVLTFLMKETLDLGTLLSNDSQKTRAYKERIKNTYKSTWLSVAEAFESLDLIARCECYGTNRFCSLCGGSRYQLNQVLFPDATRETSMALSGEADPILAQKLNEGLARALQEVGEE